MGLLEQAASALGSTLGLRDSGYAQLNSMDPISAWKRGCPASYQSIEIFSPSGAAIVNVFLNVD